MSVFKFWIFVARGLHVGMGRKGNCTSSPAEMIYEVNVQGPYLQQQLAQPHWGDLLQGVCFGTQLADFTSVLISQTTTLRVILLDNDGRMRRRVQHGRLIRKTRRDSLRKWLAGLGFQVFVVVLSDLLDDTEEVIFDDFLFLLGR